MKTLSLLILTLLCTVSAFAQPWIGPVAGNIYYNGGNVGIGTTTPGAKLEVCGEIRANFSNPITIYNTTPGGVPVASISRRDDIENASAQISAYGGMGFTTGLAGTTTSPNSSTSKLWISSNGKVGIGTTNPLGSLHVGDNSGAGVLLNNRITSVASMIPAQIAWGESNLGQAGDLIIVPRTDISSTSVRFYTNNGSNIAERMRINSNGNVCIGTTTPDSGAKLTVKGKIVASEIQVKADNLIIPDYVFKPDYELMLLSHVEEFVKLNQHLPEVPSEKEFKENGMNMAEMNALLLKKIEELTLYAIEQNKNFMEQTTDQNKRLMEQAKRIETLEKTVNNLIVK